MKEEKNITPMLAQYHKIKDQYPDALVLYRLGDFYEMFYEDAHTGARELNIVLTKKKVGKDRYIPMCGIPFHSADSYITRLVSKGYKVAICEQLEDASKAKGIVKRDVIRVLTPGTYFENEKLKSALLGIYQERGRFYIAYLDLSTGEFTGGSLNRDELISFIGKFQPKEIVVQEGYDFSDLRSQFKSIFFSQLPEDYFSEDTHSEFLGFFKTGHISAFGFDTEEQNVIYPLSAVWKYAKVTQKSFLPFISTPKPYREDSYVRLDYSAQKHLEIVSPNEGNIPLLRVMDRTLTGMGRRKLRFFLLHPLKNSKEIIKRQNAVTELVENTELREKIRDILDQIFDIERLISKISSNTSTPRDLVGLRESLKKVSKLKEISKEIKSDLLKESFERIEDYSWLIEKLDRYLEDDPPIHLKEGGLIKKGVDKDLDELKEIKEKGNEWLKSYQEKLRKETGIQSLKIGFNKVMGYYIEVTKPNLKLVPDHFRRRQTLSNAERFITDELQSFEEKILSADEKIKALEYEIFMRIREEVAFLSDRIGKTAQQVGMIDAIQSLAQIAVEKGWTKPDIHDGYEIEIKEGYHPVIKEFMPDFVPNNLKMNRNSYFHIITGPNMAGKSTFIRQSAIIILLAQTGSYIPAKKGKIGVVDAIFTRIGSGDALAKGLSTFMVEMLEMANIVNNATERSFIVLDEVGRGTSTYDGLSIGWAISEYLAEKVKVKTLFATHYHELTQLEREIKGVKNFHMDIFEDGENIKFLYRVKEGFSNKSYGVHVAKLAGIKEQIIKRAYEILYYFEEQRDKKLEEDIYSLKQKENSYLNEINELPLFKEIEDIEKDEYRQILEEIESIDIGSITPVEALVFLNDLKKKIKRLKES
ncbi:MAG TPA: DNA mismatch repair protein MutS [Persephonella sp.]|uniref:DNA mismatch repair protein MutS n=1 Tax=Persephonella marina (strain DSM 14350 / EX-H1) TaxID=123214 RepID=MUTS_PERMH|nr:MULTISPECIES: DNA mismatch repair protein MutS [Persephonella]C0QPF0.1 RecName: Full=DNA mismatch repair protein MutS [Persephonella marina EX-H1]ACO04590.1 DNA mismatch repair protein MutS [Persephonella marina EX-H1]HCB69839.1 DNA mismatch repair protein MutS [Persephonella sp.]